MQTQNILHHTIGGISFKDWASVSTLLNRGFPQNEILNILGVELPIWHQAINRAMESYTRKTPRISSKVWRNLYATFYRKISTPQTK